MGHSAFHIGHRTDTNHYGRCVGKPHVFADVRILDMATGEELPVGVVGHLGLKSPTLALGYWNDSVQTYRTALRRLLPHRGPDVPGRGGLLLPHGPRPWTRSTSATANPLTRAMSEERILARNPMIRDCTVVAFTVEGGCTWTCCCLLGQRRDPRRGSVRGGARRARPRRGRRHLRNVVVVSGRRPRHRANRKVRKFLMRQRHLAAVQS
jgi:acyl-CoA synthetase (AMP-forming)/AMP-acid ligase II